MPKNRPALLTAALLLFGLQFLFCVTPCAAASQPAAEEYILGVLPFAPAISIEETFAPLAAELATAAGRPVKLRTAPSFERFMTELREGSYDIAFIQPFDYVDIARPLGYLPLAARNVRLAGQIVVREESPVRTLQDLKGKQLGVPPKVTTLSYIVRVALKQAGLVPESDLTLVYLGSHQACMQKLMIGTVDACGVSPASVRLNERQMKAGFRQLAETPPIPPPLFVVKKTVPAATRAAIKKALLKTEMTGVKPEQRELFLGEEKRPFRATSDREYDKIRTYLKLLGQR